MPPRAGAVPEAEEPIRGIQAIADYGSRGEKVGRHSVTRIRAGVRPSACSGSASSR